MEEELRRIHGTLAPRAQAVRDALRAKQEAYDADLRTKKAALGAAVLQDVTKAMKACAKDKPVDHVVTRTPFGDNVTYFCLSEFRGLALSPGDRHGVFESTVAPVVAKAGFATTSSDGKNYVLTSKTDVPLYNWSTRDELP